MSHQPKMGGGRIVLGAESVSVRMRGSRNFGQGGSRSVWQKKLWRRFFFFFFFFFWSSAYFLRKSNGQFQRNLSFFKVLEGVQHFPGGGSNFFRGGGGGGSNCLFPIETHILFFTEVKWSISKKSIIFQGFRGGPTFSRGGPTFFRGGPIAYSL